MDMKPLPFEAQLQLNVLYSQREGIEMKMLYLLAKHYRKNLADPSDKEELEGELEDLVDAYDEQDVELPGGMPEPTTDLQAMLAEHHELGLRILDIQDAHVLPPPGDQGEAE